MLRYVCMIVNSKKRLLARKPTLRDYDVQRKIKDRIDDYFITSCKFFDTKDGKDWYVTKEDRSGKIANYLLFNFENFKYYKNYSFTDMVHDDPVYIKVPIRVSSNGQKINVANIAIIETIPFDKKELLTVTYKL